MFIGAFLYQIVFASLTSFVTEESATTRSLKEKLTALDDFAEAFNIDKQIHYQIKKFLQKNYVELYIKEKAENLMNELPPTLKEEVFFNQYGDLIQSFNFFTLFSNN